MMSAPTNTDQLLQIQPMELRFPLKLKKQVSCCMKLSNNSNHYVAFKVKTTNPKNYEVKNNPAVILPHSTFDLIVTMQALREYPPYMLCKDKFIIHSAVVKPGLIAKDITPQMFEKESGNQAEECKLRVSYVLPELDECKMQKVSYVLPRSRIVCILGAIWNSIKPYLCLELESRPPSGRVSERIKTSTSTSPLLEVKTRPLPAQSTSTTGRLLEVKTRPLPAQSTSTTGRLLEVKTRPLPTQSTSTTGRLLEVKTRPLPTQSTSTTGRLLEVKTRPLLTHRRKGVEETPSPVHHQPSGSISKKVLSCHFTLGVDLSYASN